jgi:hypothetical protein
MDIRHKNVEEIGKSHQCIQLRFRARGSIAQIVGSACQPPILADRDACNVRSCKTYSWIGPATGTTSWQRCTVLVS